jgi:hypothetical protein
MAPSFPTTCAQVNAAASGITRYSLPAMMLLPACSAGREISGCPAAGPLFIMQRSLEIFRSATASPRNWALNSNEASWLLMPAKKLRLSVNSNPEPRLIKATTSPLKRGCEFSSGPTAVPPMGNSRTGGKADSMRSMTACNCAAQPPGS